MVILAMMRSSRGRNDTVLVLAGNDTVYAGRGNDYVDTAIGNDVIYGEDGEDQIIAGVVTVGVGQSDNDLVYGGGGRDRIRSYAGRLLGRRYRGR